LGRLLVTAQPRPASLSPRAAQLTPSPPALGWLGGPAPHPAAPSRLPCPRPVSCPWRPSSAWPGHLRVGTARSPGWNRRRFGSRRLRAWGPPVSPCGRPMFIFPRPRRAILSAPSPRHLLARSPLKPPTPSSSPHGESRLSLLPRPPPLYLIALAARRGWSSAMAVAPWPGRPAQPFPPASPARCRSALPQRGPLACARSPTHVRGTRLGLAGLPPLSLLASAVGSRRGVPVAARRGLLVQPACGGSARSLPRHPWRLARRTAPTPALRSRGPLPPARPPLPARSGSAPAQLPAVRRDASARPARGRGASPCSRQPRAACPSRPALVHDARRVARPPRTPLARPAASTSSLAQLARLCAQLGTT
jgi:hypothetical protein